MSAVTPSAVDGTVADLAVRTGRGPLHLEGDGTVRTSYEGFFEDLRRPGAPVEGAPPAGYPALQLFRTRM